MAKLLGNDVVTQDEFDNFVNNDFAPMQTRVDGMAKAIYAAANSVDKITFHSKIAIAFSVVAALGSLFTSLWVVLH